MVLRTKSRTRNCRRIAGAGTAAWVLLAAASPAGWAQNKAQVPAPAKAADVQFTDVTEQLGIRWKHTTGATDDKYLIETMGGGGAFLDFDGDGRLDILLVDSGCHKFSVKCAGGRHALYRQTPEGRFADVTEQSGLRLTGYGQGVAVGDYDSDGDPDIYITNFPANTLWRNNGDGTFTDVTVKAGVAGSGWESAAAFFDYNNDGRLDLFAGRYLAWDYVANPFCGERRPGYRAYCHPDQFQPIVNLLYRNNGDGTFTDVSEASGIAKSAGKALGVVAFDFNRDGWLDLYVANDAVASFLFRNNGDGTFTEIGLLAEVAYGAAGQAESGMGADAGDYDGDGWPDLVKTNIDYEPNNLLRNLGDGIFQDMNIPANMGAVAMLYSGFGVRFADYDNDGDLDLVVLNGHVLDNAHLFREGVTFAERPFLLQNAGGRYVDMGARGGAPFEKAYVGRALAAGDYDNDGDTDLLFVTNGGAPALLRNDGGSRNSWIGFQLVGAGSNRDAIGAVVTLTAGGKKRFREIVGGASYYAAHDLRVLFGLGAAESVEQVEIRWPSGAISQLGNPEIRKYHRVEQPGKKSGQRQRRANYFSQLRPSAKR